MTQKDILEAMDAFMDSLLISHGIRTKRVNMGGVECIATRGTRIVGVFYSPTGGLIEPGWYVFLYRDNSPDNFKLFHNLDGLRAELDFYVPKFVERNEYFDSLRYN